MFCNTRQPPAAKTSPSIDHFFSHTHIESYYTFSTRYSIDGAIGAVPAAAASLFCNTGTNFYTENIFQQKIITIMN